MDWVTSLRSHIKNGKVLWKYSVSSQRLLKFDLSLLERSLIRWDSFIMKLNTMLRNNIQCAILTTKFILYIFTLLLPFSLPFFTLFFFFSLFLSFFFTLKMTIAQVSFTVNSNSPIQDYVHPDDHIQPTYESSYRKVCNWTTNWAEWNSCHRWRFRLCLQLLPAL